MFDLSRLSDRRALLLALALKVLVISCMLWEQDRWPFGAGAFAYAHGDADTYLVPIDNLVEHGSYAPDLRMPGLGAVYFLPRLLFGRQGGMNTIGVLQALLSALCVVVLMRSAQRLGANGRMATIVFVIAALGLWTNSYDLYLLAESFCISAVILSFHFFLRGWQEQSKRDLLISGAFIAWAIFLKLVCGIFLAVMVIALLMRRGSDRRARLVNTLALIAAFVVADGAWTLRNALVNHRFAPLSNGWFLGEGVDPYVDLARMVMAMGGDVVYWERPDADARWFNMGAVKDSLGHPIPNSRPAKIPEWWATQGCPLDTLLRIAQMNLQRQDTSLAPGERDRASAEVMRLCTGCREAFIAERPFAHQVKARLRLLKLFVVQPGTPYHFRTTFDRMPLHVKAVKLANVLLYVIVIVSAIVGALLFLFRPSDGSQRLLAALFFCGVLVIPFVIRYTEGRYMAPVWPLALLIVALLFSGAHRPDPNPTPRP